MEPKELVQETRKKASEMAKDNVWRTDFRVCELLTELADKIEELVAKTSEKS